MRFFFTALLSLLSLLVLAQEDNWDVYMAQYEKGAGSTVLNMGLYASAPVQECPFLLVVIVPFSGCRDGLPVESQFPELYRVSDSIEAQLAKLRRNIFAGTFTYQCEREHYFYLADTNQVRKKLSSMFRTAFPGTAVRIKIKPDPNWEDYLQFLYPNEATQEYMSDTKLVIALSNAGDKLEKARKVDHWLYFASEEDRNCFSSYLNGKGFTIESTEKVNKKEKPFSLQISRTDKVDFDHIHPLTVELRKNAKKCKGDYDGWETFVVTN